ncbi:MAG: diguanylate cyclase [Rhodoferax sp.]|nr:diguanylate cyclase [Rhodoferax sp.]
MNDEPIAGDDESLLQFVYQFPVAVMRMSGAGVIDLMNPRAVSLLVGLGLPFEADQGWGILEGLDPTVCDLVRGHLLEPGPVAEQRPIERRDPQGRLHHLALTAIIVNPDSCMVAIEDVTKRVVQERQLARERQSLAVVLEALQGYFVLMLDLDLCITQPNRSIERLLGHGATVVGCACIGLLRADSSEPVDLAAKAEQAVRQGWVTFEAEYRCADGGTIWGDTVLTTIVDEAGVLSAFVIVARDVSERRRREAALIDEALTDPLTGLLNRRGLAARVAPWLDHARAGKALTISALALDIDFFKRVNDRYGHDGGDTVLRHLGQLLMQQFRRGDIVARLGGEEFVVLLRDVPDAIALASAERMRQLLEQSPLTWKDQAIAVTTSIGVASAAGLTEVERLLHDADLALYRAKAEGRNRVVCR